MGPTRMGWSLFPFVIVGSLAVAAEEGPVVLNQYGSWRMFTVLKPPEIASDDGVKAVEYKQPENYWLNGETAPPPSAWIKPEFDDSIWLRGPAGIGCRAPFVARACFIVWDIFMSRSKDLSLGGSHGDMPGWVNRYKDRMTDPTVTLNTLDSQTGKPARAALPNYFTDAASKAVWQKLFNQLHERMRKRGLEQAMMLGWFTDCRAQKEEIDFWRDVTGDLPWISHAHFKVARVAAQAIKTGYNTSIHDIQRPEDPAVKRHYGWRKEPVIWAQQLLRPGSRGEMDMLPGSMWSAMTEITLAGGQRGFGRLGGDMWFVLKNKAGVRTNRVYDRYPWSCWPNLELCCSLLAPGPDGAVATAHFEQLREGVQECEARIFLEQSLSDPPRREKLGADLVERCQNLLDQRLLCDLRGVAEYKVGPHAYSSPYTWWFQNGVAGHAWQQSSGWRQRNASLFALAGEVEKSLRP